MKTTNQLAVTISFQNGPTKIEVQEFIGNLLDQLQEKNGKIKIDDFWGIEEYNTVTEEPELKIKGIK